MPPSIDPRLFRGLCVYQDVMVDGQTLVKGARDCPGRWELLAPHMPSSGSILDVGSNFGWFGLKLCQSSPECVVASVEGDLRSARVQRRVLELNHSQRICLLVARASAGLVERFARAGQRFDAALCLGVLHWIGDHRKFLAALGAITGRIFVEHPDPRETGAGVERIRAEIGPIGPYLQGLFPDRPACRLAQLPSHRDCDYLRELWMIGEPPGAAAGRSAGLDVSVLLASSASWPPRSWWRPQLARCSQEAGQAGDCPNLRASENGTVPFAARERPCRVLFTPAGLQVHEGRTGQPTLRQLARRARHVPQRRLLAPGQWCYRSLRSLAGNVLRRLAAP